MKKLNLILLVFLLSPTFFAQDFNTEIEHLNVSFNGKFFPEGKHSTYNNTSENGKYGVTYSIGEVTDEQRKLIDLRFYMNGNMIFSLPNTTCSDISVSNSGFFVLFDHSESFSGKLKIQIINRYGIKIVDKEFRDASLFEFSDDGNYLGVNSGKGFEVTNLLNTETKLYPNALKAFIGNNCKFIVITNGDALNIYNNNNELTINGNFEMIRGIAIDESSENVYLIDKKNLFAYSLSTGEKVFTKSIAGNFSFRDIKVLDGKVYAGVHEKAKGLSSGFVKVYNNIGNEIFSKKIVSREFNNYSVKGISAKANVDTIQWPFIPFDSMHTVWNHYEQHMGGSGPSFSYLHQGLDIITPIGENTYTVEAGFVKCVLTLGGDVYWRTAVSPVNIPDSSNGWLYAHLIPSSIQVDVGDTVDLHEYLGDIIVWSADWGHIHFVEIRDSGNVWRYDDNEWGINFNPLNKLRPNYDENPPEILDCFEGMKFGFCMNNTGSYIYNDTLSGNIDVIVKVNDYVGSSTWSQPAYKITYSIKRLSDNAYIINNRLSHILNHPYSFYDSQHFEDFASVMYQLDETLYPESWMVQLRRYHHNITNNNGDEWITLEDKNECLKTNNYPDGNYRIIVKAYDQYGNYDIDSMDVFFKNGISSINEVIQPVLFELKQNYPNPFNPSTVISYSIPFKAIVKLKIFDILGNEIKTVVNEEQTPGNYSVEIKAEGLTSGVYFYKIEAGEFTETKKMLHLK